MKLEINGIKREVQIVQAPQGSFCCLEGLGLPAFPLFVCLCEAITEKETPYGKVLVCPIFDNNGGYGSIEVDEVKNELCPSDLKRLIINYTNSYEFDNLKDVLREIMYMFEIHKTPILQITKEYVKDVMDGIITEIPTEK